MKNNIMKSVELLRGYCNSLLYKNCDLLFHRSSTRKLCLMDCFVIDQKATVT